MRKDASFTDRKLSPEEFSKKYWLNGFAPYQYHTAGIEDGRDEREQLLFNNIRALREQILFNRKYGIPRHSRATARINGKIKKLTILATTSVVICGVALIVLCRRHAK